MENDIGMLSWKEITHITTAVVREQRADLDVVAVTRADAERVEVLIADTCGGEGPGRRMLNVTRAAATHLEEELRDALRRAFPPMPVP